MLEPLEISFFKPEASELLREILKPVTQVISSVGKQTSQPKLEEEDDETIYDDDVFTRATSDVSFLPTEA